jgi:hypothetical protein
VVTRVTQAVTSLDVERESTRRGWAWGQAVRGVVVTPGRTGLQTVQFQRGVITAVTATTIVVTSADGVSLTWTVGSGTAVLLPRAVERRRDRPTTTTATTTTTPSTDAAAADTTEATTSTSTSTTSTSTSTGTTPAATTSGLPKDLLVRVWGTGTGSTPAARLVIPDPRAPRPSTTTSTTTSTTGSTTTTTPPLD